ncbi:hypothetical protein NDU88_001307, partial [Pleurodeles waltl]
SQQGAIQDASFTGKNYSTFTSHSRGKSQSVCTQMEGDFRRSLGYSDSVGISPGVPQHSVSACPSDKHVFFPIKSEFYRYR